MEKATPKRNRITWTVIASVISFIILQQQVLWYYSPAWDCDPGLLTMVSYVLMLCFPIYMLGATFFRVDNGKVRFVRREDRLFPWLPFLIIVLSAATAWLFSHKSRLRSDVPVIYAAHYADDTTPRSIELRSDGTYRVRVDNDCSGYELYGTYNSYGDTLCLVKEDFRWDDAHWHCTKCMVITSEGVLRGYDADPDGPCYMHTVVDKR